MDFEKFPIIDTFRRFAYPFSIGMVHMEIDIEQMDKIMQLFESSSLTEITVEQDNYRLTLKKNSSNQRADMETELTAKEQEEQLRAGLTDQLAGQSDEEPAVDDEEESAETFFITSPIVGTFYSRPSPEDQPYVEEGDIVEQGDTVCIVEAMKVMNEVNSDHGGEIVEMCVEEGDPVEYGQKLYRLIPVENS